jgi:thiol:disulfide interchange protein DsbD
MGFLLLAVAVFLITALPKDRILPTLLYFIGFSFIVWFWGEVLEFKTGRWAKIGRVFILLALMLTGWGMFKPAIKELKWLDYNANTLQAAQNSGRDTLIEFTADWCLNCRTVEYLVFNNSEVKQYLKENKINLLKADLTENNPYADKTLKELTGQSGIPFTIVIKPNGNKTLLQGIYQPNELLNILKK